MSAFLCLGRGDLPRLPWQRIPSEERNLDGERRALARTRPDIDSVAQQVCQALDNGETEGEAFAGLACGVFELMELAENRCEFLFGNADPGVPDLDAQLVTAQPAA